MTKIHGHFNMTENAILEGLRRKERQCGFRVLLAVESGSRAWGFASPDSDYDVRFIYVYPRDAYLKMKEPEDALAWFDDGDLDYSGWELRKALRLFAGCNLSMNEHLGSPIVYEADAEFLAELKGLIPRYFREVRAIYHYLGVAANFTRPLLDGEEVGIKKMFYILRPVMAAQWVARHGSMPPTEFARLLEDAELSREVRSEIERLQEEKTRAAEREMTRPGEILRDWVRESLDRLEADAKKIGKREPAGWEPLDELFMKVIGE